MNLKVGIVGLPNAGKSTLFNALLKKQAAFVANYPFATIEPNIGVIPVPDDRLVKLADIVETAEGRRPPMVQATIEFVDIAGLVKGAAEGQGLGNKFLAHIREVHLIAHVIRIFNDPDVVHVGGNTDPKRDAEIVDTELMLADLATLNKQSEPRGVKDREAQKRWRVITALKVGLNKGLPARDILTDTKDKNLVSDLHLITLKPVLYVLNVGENQLSDLQALTNAQGTFPNSIFVSAKTESELAALSPEDQIMYLKDLGLEASGLDRLARKSYEMLGLISFLTCGIKEARAWTVERRTKAPQAAGVIHTDFEKKFIKADCVTYEDFVRAGGWVKAREIGKVRSEGKEYEIQDGDVVEFKIGT